MDSRERLLEELEREIFVLAQAAMEGTASDEDLARLDEIVCADPEAARYLTLSVQTSQHLRDWAESRRPRPAAAELAARPSSPILGFLADIGRQGWRFVSDHVGMLALLVGFTVVGSLAIWVVATLGNGRPDVPQMAQQKADESEIPSPQSPIPNPQPPAPAPTAPVARLTRAADCHWNGQAAAPAVGRPLPPGQSLNLASGVAEIDFDIGTKVVLQGPAAFQLLSATSARLQTGKATVEIKTLAARGFKILTPAAEYVDQGTEFGIEVTPSGNSKIHVFKGQVDIKREAREGQAAPATQRLVENIGARMEAGEDGMTLVADTGENFIRSLDEAGRDLHVVAYWRFEDRPVGILLPDTAGSSRPVCATADSSFNGNDLYATNRSRPMFSADVPAAAVAQTGRANRSCLDTSQPTVESWQLRNVYTHSQFSHAAPLDIQRFVPAQWTIEASVKAAKLTGKGQGFLGRDTYFTYEAFNARLRDPARLTFQINARDRFAIGFHDADGRFHEAVAEDLPVEAGRWYHLAATSDRRVLRLYVDALDGRGYVQRAATELPATGSTALGKGQDDAEWTIGRAGNAGDPPNWPRFVGWMDEVRISDVAREPKEFLFAPQGEGLGARD